MQESKRRRRTAATAAVVAAGLLIAACGSSDGGNGNGSSSGGGDGAGEELTEINVAIMPLSGIAHFFVALDKGYFEDEGLKLNTEMAAGGAAVVPGLIAGE